MRSSLASQRPTDAEAAESACTLIHRTVAKLAGDEYLHCTQPVEFGRGYFHLIKEN
jgi:hypothetical protein